MTIVLSLLGKVIFYYSWIVIIYILMSWLPNARESQFGQLISKIVEPYLEPFRKIIPPLGMFDISAIVAILVLRYAVTGINVLITWF